MAQKRMLDKKISLSEKVASLDILGQLLYTWMIPHSDDFGLLQGSPRTIKALVIPMIDCTAEEVGIHLETMWKIGLLDKLQILGNVYYKIVGSERNQTLKKDRNPQTILPIDFEKDNTKNWNKCENIIIEAKNMDGNHMEYNGIQMETELKGTEEKRREDNTTNVVANKFAAKNSNYLIGLFKDVNPNYKTLFANKTQRAALDRMIAEHGIEKMEKAIKYLSTSNSKPYAPTITTPIELEKKMGTLIAFLNKERNKGKVAVQQ